MGWAQVGWNKQQAYVFAFGRGGAADVTRRYTRDMAATLLRRTQASVPPPRAFSPPLL